MSKQRTITICSSATFYQTVLSVAEKLEAMGWKVLLPETATRMQKANNFNIAHYKTWLVNQDDYPRKATLMKNHFDKVMKADVILVINEEKQGSSGYIEPNTLMEMALAFYHNKPIYLYNSVSRGLNYEEEILGMAPIVIDQIL